MLMPPSIPVVQNWEHLAFPPLSTEIWLQRGGELDGSQPEPFAGLGPTGLQELPAFRSANSGEKCWAVPVGYAPQRARGVGRGGLQRTGLTRLLGGAVGKPRQMEPDVQRPQAGHESHIVWGMSRVTGL